MKIEISMSNKELENSYDVTTTVIDILAEATGVDPSMFGVDLSDNFNTCMREFAARGGCDRIESKLGTISALETPTGVLMILNINEEFVCDSGRLTIKILKAMRPAISTVVSFGKTIATLAEDLMGKVSNLFAEFGEKWLGGESEESEDETYELNEVGADEDLYKKLFGEESEPTTSESTTSEPSVGYVVKSYDIRLRNCRTVQQVEIYSNAPWYKDIRNPKIEREIKTIWSRHTDVDTSELIDLNDKFEECEVQTMVDFKVNGFHPNFTDLDVAKLQAFALLRRE